MLCVPYLDAEALDNLSAGLALVKEIGQPCDCVLLILSGIGGREPGLGYVRQGLDNEGNANDVKALFGLV